MFDAMDWLRQTERDEYEEEEKVEKLTETQESCGIRVLVVGEDNCLTRQVTGLNFCMTDLTVKYLFGEALVWFGLVYLN